MRAVQAAVVALLLAARCDLEADEHPALLGQDRADLLLENLQVGELVHTLVAGRARYTGEAHASAPRDRMAAVGLVSAVLADDMDQVLRRGLGGRHQRTEI